MDKQQEEPRTDVHQLHYNYSVDLLGLDSVLQPMAPRVQQPMT